MARAARGKTVTLPRTMNYATGKNSMYQTGFSDTAWGEVTRSYTKSAAGLSDEKFRAIINDAQVFMKRTRVRNRTTNGTEAKNPEEDERACLVDYSGSESDCE
jgi:hypothetical protein